MSKRRVEYVRVFDAPALFVYVKPLRPVVCNPGGLRPILAWSVRRQVVSHEAPSASEYDLGATSDPCEILRERSRL